MACDRQLEAREGQTGPHGVTERLVVAAKAGNAGEEKEPQFKGSVTRSKGPGDWR